MAIEMIGKRFGKLVVLKESGRGKRGLLYECKCDCGNNAIFPGKYLRDGINKSCGCLNHGLSKTRPYRVWGNMKKRCSNKNCPDYPRYGGRGITYCEEWESFESFWNDMKDGYEDHLTLDRINVNGGYSKDNCRWVDFKTQQNNRRDTRFLEYNGKTYTISELAEIVGMNRSTLSTRLFEGLSIEEAISKPIPEKVTITFKGKTKTVPEFAKEYGLTYRQLQKRLHRGWTVERALTQPLSQQK